MKKVVFLAIFLIGFLMLAGKVSAQTCVENQRILRLSDINNAHGEVYNGSGNYPIEICYDDIFGQQYLGANPHTCNGGNLVLNLSATTNAHAEALPGVNYGVGVCYGDLECTFVPSGNCPAGNVTIVHLSSNTNAHLGVSSSYNAKICCSSPSATITPPPTPTGNAYWAYMNNGPIPEGSIVYVENTLKLIATNLNPNSVITFEIFDDDPVFDDGIRTGIEALDSDSDGTGRAEVTWQITQSDYDKGKGINEEDLELYFEANDGSTTLTSGQINLTNNIINQPPVANITNPVHRGIYLMNIPIDFDQSSYDIDGTITSVKWNISEDNVVRTEASFPYIFTTAGQKTISLEVVDNQGAKGHDEISIVVIGAGEENQISAFISKPKNREIVRSSSLVVDYWGNESYVISSTIAANNCAISVNCVAGNCPSSVPAQGACPAMSVGGTFGVFSNLYFNWTFFSNFGNGFGFSSVGLDQEIGQQQFETLSNALNDKSIVLKLNHTIIPILEDSDSVIFTIFDGNPGDDECIGGDLLIFDNNDALIGVRDVDIHDGINPPACAGPDGDNNTLNDNCACSNAWWCDQNVGCQPQTPGPNGEIIDECKEYTSESTCNSDAFNVLNYDNPTDPLFYGDPGTEDDCNRDDFKGYASCTCAWDNSENKCKVRRIFTEYGSGSGGPNCISACNQYPTELSSCSEGYIKLAIDLEFTQLGDPPPACDYTTAAADCTGTIYRDRQCGRPTLELPFFGMMQFGISIAVILAIYILIVRAGRKKR